MRLEVQLGVYLGHAVEQHLVHRDLPGAQVLGAAEDRDVGKCLAGVVDDHVAVGVDYHRADLRTLGERGHDVAIERLPAEIAEILSPYPLAVMAHRDDGRNGRGCRHGAISTTRAGPASAPVRRSGRHTSWYSPGSTPDRSIPSSSTVSPRSSTRWVSGSSLKRCTER